MNLLAKYPFIVDFQEYVSREAQLPDSMAEIAGDPRLVGLALERVESLLKGGQVEDLLDRLTTFEAVTSFYLGLAIASRASRTLLATLVSRELQEASRMFSRESEETLLYIAGRLGIEVKREAFRIPWVVSGDGKTVYRLLTYSMSVWDYLRLLGGAARTVSLANSFLIGGRVLLDVKGLRKLIIYRARHRMEEEAARLASLESPLIAEAVESLAKEFGPESSPGAIEARDLDYDSLPDCVRDIIEKGLSGGMLSDSEFFLLVTFMANVRGPPRLLAEIIGRQLDLGGEEALSLSLKLLRVASKFKPYDCSKGPGSEICADCPGDLVKYYLSRLRSKGSGRKRARRARGP